MITDVKDTVQSFLQEMLNAKGVRIIMINKADGGWVAEAEVAEVNQYLAAIKPQYQVFEKEHYIVKLDANLEISSYKRVRDSEEDEG